MKNDSKQRNAALLVIDVQKGLFERSTPIFNGEQVLENINALIVRARQAGVPVIFIQHANESTLVKESDAWQLHPKSCHWIMKRLSTSVMGTRSKRPISTMSWREEM